MNDQIKHQVAFLEQAHRFGLQMGLTEEMIIKSAMTNGDIEVEAMKEYLAAHYALHMATDFWK